MRSDRGCPQPQRRKFSQDPRFSFDAMKFESAAAEDSRGPSERLMMNLRQGVEEEQDDDGTDETGYNDKDLVDAVLFFGKALAGGVESPGARSLLEFGEADAALHDHGLVHRLF